jgi:hypothetical protein
MKLRITLVLASLTVSLNAGAQQPPPSPEQAWRQFCAPDIEKFCKEADKNNKTVECLGEHEKDLSEDCTHKFLYKYKAREICKADFERLCKDVQPLGPCVKAHDAELSKECRAALVKGSKQQKVEAKADAKAEAAKATAANDTKEAPKAKPAKKGAKKKKAE